jgi:hypothetical protein
MNVFKLILIDINIKLFKCFIRLFKNHLLILMLFLSSLMFMPYLSYVYFTNKTNYEINNIYDKENGHFYERGFIKVTRKPRINKYQRHTKYRFKFRVPDNYLKLENYEQEFEIDLERVNKSITFCPIIPQACNGELNAREILKQASLDKKIHFFDDYQNVNSFKIDKDIFYFKNNSTEYDESVLTTNDLSFFNQTDSIYFNNDIKLGGHWKPNNCSSRYRTAIIIPYLNRLSQLKALIYYLHLFLARQMIDYRIFVIEPFSNNSTTKFNRGLLYNIGFSEIIKLDSSIDCIVLHDVDLLPENDKNLYTCSKNPRHLSAAVDKFNYNLPYYYLVGGVLSMKVSQYRELNGLFYLFFMIMLKNLIYLK